MAGTSNPPGQAGPPGFADLLNLFGSNNPLSSMARSVEQFRQTMESLNSIAKRVDRLLDDIEGPLRVIMPQLTKAVDQASTMFATLSDPVDRVAPGLSQLADMLSSPAMTELPRRLADMMDTMASLPKALAPLGSMAEMAGGLFGGMRNLGLTGLSAARPVATAATPAPAAPPARKAAVRKAPARKNTAKKAATKRSTAAKRAPAKKAAAKKAAAKKAPAKRASPTKATTGRTAKSAKATFARSAAKSGRR